MNAGAGETLLDFMDSAVAAADKYRGECIMATFNGTTIGVDCRDAAYTLCKLWEVQRELDRLKGLYR